MKCILRTDTPTGALCCVPGSSSSLAQFQRAQASGEWTSWWKHNYTFSLFVSLNLKFKQTKNRKERKKNSQEENIHQYILIRIFINTFLKIYMFFSEYRWNGIIRLPSDYLPAFFFLQNVGYRGCHGGAEC